MHNKTRNRTHACLYCEYAFQTKALRDNHMSKVHGKERERTFSCAECGFAFEQRANLQKHEREMHISRGAGKLTCSVCNANFDQKYDLRRYVLVAITAGPTVLFFFGFRQTLTHVHVVLCSNSLLSFKASQACAWY